MQIFPYMLCRPQAQYTEIVRTSWFYFRFRLNSDSNAHSMSSSHWDSKTNLGFAQLVTQILFDRWRSPSGRPFIWHANVEIKVCHVVTCAGFGRLDSPAIIKNNETWRVDLTGETLRTTWKQPNGNQMRMQILLQSLTQTSWHDVVTFRCTIRSRSNVY